MANLTVRGIDYRVADRLRAFAARNKRPTSEEARDILTRAVGFEPKSGLPPPPGGRATPWEPEGRENWNPPKECLTVRDVPQRVLRKLKASAKRNGRTTSAEARAMITEAIRFDRALRKGEESAAAFLTRALAPLRELGFYEVLREVMEESRPR